MLYQPWHIGLFGGLRLTQGDRTITRFPAQKSASLLAYLALNPGAVHPRDQLADLLWPDAHADSARQNLRQALLHLRRMLDPPGRADNAVIIGDRASVMLNPDAVTTDVLEYQRLLSEGETAARAEKARLLEAACALCVGPLLPGLYDAWVDAERKRLSSSLRATHIALSRIHFELGDADSAITNLRRCVALDPLDLTARIGLIRALARTGRPAEAARELSDARDTWHRELGEELPPRLEEEASQLPALPLADTSNITRRKAERVGVPACFEPRARLPVPLTRFFGRQDEIAQIIGALTPESGTRLVTIIGPGGAGKTRTALQAGTGASESYKGRVWFVPLGDVTESSLIANAVMSVFGVEHVSGDFAVQIGRCLGKEPALVILDNLEHLEGAPREVQNLLEKVPELSALTTSRIPLGIAGEKRIPLTPLEVPQRPGTPERLLEFPSVEMFVDRARNVKPDFQITARNAESVAAVCARLEGLPLAIELAAARASILTPAQMVEELKDRFAFLASRGRGFPERHRTLRAVLDSTLEGMDRTLRATFARLSVFRGGCTLNALRDVCECDDPASTVEALARLSLVNAAESGDEMRFSMLETVREYAWSLVPDSERQAIQRRHAEFVLTHAREYGRSLNTPREYEMADVVGREIENVRAALAWLIDNDSATGLELLTLLQRFWYVRGYFEEAQRWNELAIEKTEEIESADRARAYNSAGVFARDRGLLQTAEGHCRAALEMAVRIGDSKTAAFARHCVGLICVDSGKYDEGIGHAEGALKEFRAQNSSGFEAMALNLLAHAHLELAKLKEAERYSTQALQATRDGGNSWLKGTALNTRGTILGFQDRREEADKHFEESLRLAREIGNRRGEALALYNQAMMWIRFGNCAPAERSLAEALAVFEELGDQAGLTFTLEALSFALIEQDLQAAASLLIAADALRDSLNVKRAPLDQPEFERAMSRLADSFSAEKLERLRDESCTMSLPQAIAFCRQHLTAPMEHAERSSFPLRTF